MSEKNQIQFSISIVSHGHRGFVISLLDDLARLNRQDIEVVLTWNLDSEKIDFPEKHFPFKLTEITNVRPKGFAANHNSAFKCCTGSNFVVLNPDISLPKDPFTHLLKILNKHYPCICAPSIKNSQNEIEDSARFFPSPLSLSKKAIAKIFNYSSRIDQIPSNNEILEPDWIAGMFMVIPCPIYKKLNGLREQYHLYYEDVDFCARARYAGIEIYVSKEATAIHHAQRKSHRNLRFFIWHLESAGKFFVSKAYIALMLMRIHKKVLHFGRRP
jgi:GT2 family glycosyltransferase